MGTTGKDNFGDLLRRYRLAAGLTQEQLAERAGLSGRGISDLERGARRSPRRETVRLLVDALDVPSADRAAFLQAAQRSPVMVSTQNRVDHLLELPALPKPLIGRGNEIERVLRHLKSNRMVTLTGPGGIGKTSLAIETCRLAAEDFADGVIFVSLAHVRDPTLVMRTISNSLGLAESATEPAAKALTDHIADKTQLLVLDNLEQVASCTPALAHLLKSCRNIKILATSRIALRLQGEHAHEVPPLSLPAPGALYTAGELEGWAAVSLFVERAQCVQRNFELNGENASAIAEICCRLDGLPLAIELASARCNVLSPRDMLTRSNRLLSILTGGRRDAPTRHESLRTAIGWSYDLLSPQAQLTFRRLSCFADGWSMEAAESVVSHATAVDVISAISELVEASLVQSHIVTDGQLRFTMLATVHEYATEKLAESGEEAEIRHAHAIWFVEFAEKHGPRLQSQSSSRVAAIEPEESNLRSALVWLANFPDPVWFFRVCNSMSVYWHLRGRFREGNEWASQAMKRYDEAPGAEGTLVLGFAAWFARVTGDVDRARKLASWQLTEAIKFGSKYSEGHAHDLLGFAAVDQEDFDDAAAQFRKAAEIWTELAEPVMKGMTLVWLADVAVYRGEFDEAQPLIEDALKLFHSVGARDYVTDALSTAAEVALARGETETAAELWRERLKNSWDIWSLCWSLGGLAVVAAAGGEWERSARMFGALEALRERSGSGQIAGSHLRFYNREMERLCSALTGDEIARAWMTGREMTIDEVQEEAQLVAIGGARPSAMASPSRAESLGLTARERAVTCLIARGRSNRQIAEDLFIEVPTVKRHITNILTKLDLTSRTALAAFVHDQDLCT